MRKQDALFQDVIDNIILYRCDWKIGDSKVITVRTKGRNLNAAKIKLVKKLGYKTHDNKDASLLKLFDTIEKIYDIKFVDFAFV